jgi:hypothetical protein
VIVKGDKTVAWPGGACAVTEMMIGRLAYAQPAQVWSVHDELSKAGDDLYPR